MLDVKSLEQIYILQNDLIGQQKVYGMCLRANKHSKK